MTPLDVVHFLTTRNANCIPKVQAPGLSQGRSDTCCKHRVWQKQAAKVRRSQSTLQSLRPQTLTAWNEHETGKLVANHMASELWNNMKQRVIHGHTYEPWQICLHFISFCWPIPWVWSFGGHPTQKWHLLEPCIILRGVLRGGAKAQAWHRCLQRESHILTGTLSTGSAELWMTKLETLKSFKDLTRKNSLGRRSQQENPIRSSWAWARLGNHPFWGYTDVFIWLYRPFDIQWYTAIVAMSPWEERSVSSIHWACRTPSRASNAPCCGVLSVDWKAVPAVPMYKEKRYKHIQTISYIL